MGMDRIIFWMKHLHFITTGWLQATLRKNVKGNVIMVMIFFISTSFPLLRALGEAIHETVTAPKATILQPPHHGKHFGRTECGDLPNFSLKPEIIFDKTTRNSQTWPRYDFRPEEAHL